MGDSNCPARLQRPLRRLRGPYFALWSSVLLIARSGMAAQDVASAQQPPATTVALACKLQDFFGHPVSDLEIAVRSAVPPVTRSVIITLANGSANFNGLSPGPYDVTVAGGILLPPRRVQLNSPASTLVLRLPLSLPQAGRAYDTVSVEQLTVSERAQTAAYRRTLELCQAKGLTSVAYPAISTGVYHFPADRAAGIAVSSVVAALAAASAVTRVIFCCFSQGSARLHEGALDAFGSPCA